uniref:Uncharacterized protein n=2 Tax=Clastoptera arizonana TaxID=38151 RepID=A0A1B6DYN2_9HEMI
MNSNYLFEVIVGTYEEYVLGYQLVLKENGDLELVQSFATHSHRASVRSLATKGKLLVSGSVDEMINIYDMEQRKEIGAIMENSGTITCLCFTPDGSHLVVASEDGSIKFFRVGSWQIEKDFTTAHKGTAVNSISIHPTGKMALSVGKDHTLRTWNLVKGRPAYATNLASRCKNLEMVVWSPGGNYYAVPMDSKLELFCIETAGVVFTLNFESKVTCLSFNQNLEEKKENEIFVGEASGKFSCYCLKSGKEIWHIVGSNRIKSLCTSKGYLVLGTSTGEILIYKLNNSKIEHESVTSIDTGCRITCLTIYETRPIAIKNEQTKDNNPDQIRKKKKSMFQIKNAPKDSKNCHKGLNYLDVKCTVRKQKWRVECSKQ